MWEWLEYAAAWVALKSLGLLPRRVARAVGAWLAALAYFIRPPLRRAAISNLRVAFPEWGDAQRLRTIRQLVKHLGWMAGEFSQFPRYTRSEEHTSELQSRLHLVCRLLLEKKKKNTKRLHSQR